MAGSIDITELSEEQIEEMRRLLDEGSPAAPPTRRRVEVDGIALDVDMRRMRDYRTLALVAKIERGDEFAAVELFQWILGDDLDRVVEELSDGDGFCDAEAFARFSARVLEAVGAKN